ncbi:hypothetical protein [Paenirhodobacter populi]|uniref:hypothetical protein n=1 Tax=Paenirhodobacter populi TaxID=2306993 RepID=UPI0013E30058|nr:hypothetical protein [Sinirhodobacter populi]
MKSLNDQQLSVMRWLLDNGALESLSIEREISETEVALDTGEVRINRTWTGRWFVSATFTRVEETA